MRRNRAKFWVGLIITLVVIASSVVSGYFIIDKVLVPKYFSSYGINNLQELVGVVTTIYVVPDEKDFISNPYSEFDSETSTNKLIKAGFPTLATGSIDYEAIAKNDFTFTPSDDFVDNFILLTDKEIASIAGNIVSSGILISNFKDLSVLDTLNIELKQIILTPDEETSVLNPKLNDADINDKSQEKDIISTTKDASILATLKLDTESARKQIADHLQMPRFLVDWIIPDIMYVTSEMHTRIDQETGKRIYEDATLSINSKTAKQSEVLLNLLISFIFPENTFTIDSFANEIGSLIIEGINILGQMEFATISFSGNTTQAGIKLYI